MMKNYSDEWQNRQMHEALQTIGRISSAKGADGSKKDSEDI